VHISSVAPPAITRQPLRQFGERLRDACLRKWGITDADTVACEAAVDAQMSISCIDGGFGINPVDPSVFYAASVGRACSALPSNVSLLLTHPPPPLAGPALPPLPAPAQDDPDMVVLHSQQLAQSSLLTPTVAAALAELSTAITLPAAPSNAEAALFTSLPHLQVLALDNGRMPCITLTSLRVATTLLRKQDTAQRIAGQLPLARRLRDLATDTARRFLSMLPINGLQHVFFSDSTYGDVMRSILSITLRVVPADHRCAKPCNAVFDANHAHRCAHGNAVMTRHNNINNELIRICNNAGITTEPEKKAGPASSKRGDALLHFYDRQGQRILTDVSVAHAECYPMLSLDVVLSEREKIKSKKYALVSQQQGRKFIPFVLSSMGTLAPQATELLKLISRRALDYGYTTDSSLFFRQSLISILVTLHRGNLIVQHHGLSYVRKAVVVGPI